MSYQATCTSINGGAAGAQSSATSPIRVRNLSIRKTYTCKVAVRNGAGTAATSTASHSVETNGAIASYRDPTGTPS